MDYLDFDLLLRHEGSQYKAIVVHSPGGEGATSFVLPFTPLEIENFLLRVGQPRRGTRRVDSPQMAAVKKFGEQLYGAIFQKDVLTCLHISLTEARNRHAGLRIRLRMNEATELADLPWEYLYSPRTNTFLALSTETPIVRYLELSESVEPLRVVGALRVLVVVSSPNDVPQLDVQDEWKRLLDATKTCRESHSLVLEVLQHATVATLQTRLQESKFHVLHFIGHGGFDEQSQTGVLFFEDERGNARKVSDESFAVLLGNHKAIRLVVLNACDGARTSRVDPFAGVSHSLLQRGLPAAIAMQFEISDKAARVFAEVFYGAIARGYPVDSALVEARAALYLGELGSEWGTPVLFMRAPDGRIFDVQPTRMPHTPPTVIHEGRRIERKSRWEAFAVLPRRPLVLLMVAAIIGFVLAGSSVLWRYLHPALRFPRVAVVGPTNDTQDVRYDWLSTEIADRLSANLDVSGLTVVPRQDVVHAQSDIFVPADKCSASLNPTFVNDLLAASYLVFGKFHLNPSNPSNSVHVSLCLQTNRGRILDEYEKDIPDGGAFLVVAEATDRFRRLIGKGDISFQDLQGIYPQNIDARRLYFEGLTKLRTYNAQDALTTLQNAATFEHSNALISSAMADAWSMLRYDENAKAEAKKAVQFVTASFPLNYRTEIDARLQEMNNQWDLALDSYGRLFRSQPERLDYGLKVASVQLLADKPKDALATLDALSRLPGPIGSDPRILLTRARAFQALPDYKNGIQSAQSALALAKQRNAHEMQANALLELCWAYMKHEAAAEKALEACDEAKSNFAASGDYVSAAVALNDMATWLGERERYGDAKLAYERVIAIHTQAKDQRDLAGALLNSAKISILQNKPLEAEPLLSRSIEVSKSIHDKYDEALARVNLSDVYRTRGDMLESAKQAGEARELAKEIPDRSIESSALSALAQTQSEGGDVAGALDTYNIALTIRKGIEEPEGIATTMSRIGDVYLRMGKFAESAESYEAAGKIYDTLQKPDAAAQVVLGRAELDLEQNRFPESADKAEQALKVFQQQEGTESQESQESQADALALLIQALVGEGNNKLVEAENRKKTLETLKVADPDVLLDVALAKGLLLIATGKSQEAIGILESASVDAEKSGRRFAALQIQLAGVAARERSGDHKAAQTKIAEVAASAKQCVFNRIPVRRCGFTLISDKAALLARSLGS